MTVSRESLTRHTFLLFVLLLGVACCRIAAQDAPATAGKAAPDYREIRGVITDEQGRVVVGAVITARTKLITSQTTSGADGHFLVHVPIGPAKLTASGNGIRPMETPLSAADDTSQVQLRVHYSIPRDQQTVVITATSADPSIDRRNDAVYRNTLFLRDDQLFDTLDGGINAGQHEGGGKSIEVRRFGFNLDHGGANGGLKVLVDDVPQNQATQGHGQGYLGALKSLSPELVDDVDIINGPFSAEYGDFSALGVVHIRLKDKLEDRWTLRAQGGSFNGYRTFVAWSPQLKSDAALLAWEHAYTDGPFKNPLRYTRDNVTADLMLKHGDTRMMGFKANAGRNDFDSSGQIPLDLVYAGTLDRFGFMDPSDGGNVRNGTASAYYKRLLSTTSTVRADAYVNRSLFDLYSDFTFFLNDPVRGDGIQQHDSRLQDGGSLQYVRGSTWVGLPSLFTAGANLADSWINVDLFHAAKRRVIAPVAGNPTTQTNVHLLNPAVYAQQGIDFPRVHIDVGLRFDEFRFAITDRVNADGNGTSSASSVQPKMNLVYTPLRTMPIALHFNYGRAATSQDARGIALDRSAPRLAATDFYMIGISRGGERVSAKADVFLIDRQHENVYDPDNGTMQYQGPSRSYGWELKGSLQISRLLSANAGLTQVANAFYRETSPRSYVDSAPHSVGNASLTLNGWRGLYSSLRYRHIGHYLLVNPDATDVPFPAPYASSSHAIASGLDVLDFAARKKLALGFEWNISVDNLNNKRYYETQNMFNSRITPLAPAEARVHGTPGYPLGFTTGLTWRFE